MFKVGDRVKGQYGDVFYTGTIESISEKRLEVKKDDGTMGWGCRKRDNGVWAAADGCDDGIHNLELISSLTNNQMGIKEAFVLALTSEPKKSFRKAGITNGDDLLTEDGQKIFLTWLLHTKHSDEFKTGVVDGLLAEQEK